MQKVVKLNSRPYAHTITNLNEKEFILHEEITAEENTTQAPQKCGNQVQKEKLLLSIPGSASKQNDTERDIGNTGN